MATRRVSTDGLLYTAERLSDLAGAEPAGLVTALANLDLPLAMLNAPGRDAAFQEITRMEYPRQGRRPEDGGHPREEVEALLPDEIRAEKVAFLRRIGEACAAAGIRCAYAHGPWPEPFCEASRAYVEAVDDAARRAGVTPVAGTPVCLPAADWGDEYDHVRPERRPAYSERYRKLAAPALGLPP
jgi:hypothetical protein